MKKNKPTLIVTTWDKAPQAPAECRPVRSFRPMRSLQGSKSLRSTMPTPVVLAPENNATK